jgi:hypothetical protein
LSLRVEPLRMQPGSRVSRLCETRPSGNKRQATGRNEEPLASPGAPDTRHARGHDPRSASPRLRCVDAGCRGARRGHSNTRPRPAAHRRSGEDRRRSTPAAGKPAAGEPMPPGRPSAGRSAGTCRSWRRSRTLTTAGRRCGSCSHASAAGGWTGSNLPTAIKATEDALAFLMGACDGDPRWRSEFAQEPGGAFGVRIELEVVDGDGGK